MAEVSRRARLIVSSVPGIVGAIALLQSETGVEPGLAALGMAGGGAMSMLATVAAVIASRVRPPSDSNSSA